MNKPANEISIQPELKRSKKDIFSYTGRKDNEVLKERAIPISRIPPKGR